MGQLHELPLAQNAPGPVLVAGEKEIETARKQKEHGIKLHGKIAESLVALGERLDVAVPKALTSTLGQTDS